MCCNLLEQEAHMEPKKPQQPNQPNQPNQNKDDDTLKQPQTQKDPKVGQGHGFDRKNDGDGMKRDSNKVTPRE